MKIQRVLVALAAPLLLSTVPLTAKADTDPRVTALIRESGVALHTGAMGSMHLVHFKAKVVSVGLPGTANDWVEVGGTRSAQTYSTPPLAGGSGWDGTESWNLDQSGLVWVDGGEAGRANAISQTFFFNYDLWTPRFGGATVAWVGTRTEKGRSYDVLTVTAPGSKLPFDLWFDHSTHLPTRLVQVIGSIVATTTLADFRPVDGVMFPFAIDTTSQGNSTALTMIGAEVNPAGGDANLAKPQSTVHNFSITGATQTSVPIEISENHVYLNVMLNGKGPYHFIFDTGGANVVDPAVAKEIGALGSGSAQVGGVGNTTESSSFATVDTLQIGDATVKNQVFTVLPVRKGFGMTAGLPTDGLIGYEVLSRFITTFNYAGRRVTFHMPGTYTAPAGASVVPIAQNSTQPQFDCAIDAIPTVCTVDTGARDSLTFYAPFITAHPDVVPAKLSAKGVNGFGVGGPSLGALGRVSTLSFGNYTLHDLIGDYTAQTEGAFSAPFLGANVGGGVWKRFTVTFDYDKLTMTLTPNGSLDAPDAWDRSGIFLINTGVVTIADVRPGTPAAAAGLRKGEAIVSINGTPTTSLTLQAIRETLIGAPGNVVHLVVRSKDGTTRDATITLADYA